MLHIVNKSPYERNNLASCLRLAKQNSVILLIEDAVYAALADGDMGYLISDAVTNFTFYALKPDLIARGLQDKSLIDGVTLIDYDGFVELTKNRGGANKPKKDQGNQSGVHKNNCLDLHNKNKLS